MTGTTHPTRPTVATTEDRAPSPQGGGAPDDGPDEEAVVSLGWGRVLFSHSFESAERIAETLLAERDGERDIAIYVRDPHLVLAAAPESLFLDPSHTYRLDLSAYRPGGEVQHGFTVRPMRSKRDAQEINRLYSACGMVQAPIERFMANLESDRIVHLVAEDRTTGAALGTVTGLDHLLCFNEPEHGASLWSLAVDPHGQLPGVGEALIRALAEHFQARERRFLDLSVMHDNEPAIALYEKLGFERIPLFSVKCRNSFNEPLYTAPEPRDRLKQDAEVIIREARRRGIAVEIEDSESGLFQLTFGGRAICCDESLSDFTSALAERRCEDRQLSRRLFIRAGLPVPEQIEAGDPDEERAFLERNGRIIAKPARRSSHAPVMVDIANLDALEHAVAEIGAQSPRVLLEEMLPGDHLRVLVIENRVIAGALRRPAEIVGNGRASVRQLVEVQSRRRAAATGGESRIPWDEETRGCILAAGYSLDGVPGDGEILRVRRTPNLRFGGTIHDVTAMMHHQLVDAATTASRMLGAPVVGIDFMVDNPTEPDFALIGADPRPSLAHHQPQPAAARFVDMLFPQTTRRGGR
ncbi:N-acetylglutaminylglutamine synthetase [Marivibrio halodurans]|uniref:N-acetylglutaminylglutamine synthetase n=1 Tax=Marivibrio halodurans TaxID=2039722 RepID=A0A8J7V162_9PROT|nr:N-acetylglutaminylglutamine synthetase [Marivibrio halodurans]MBP5855507.1 N-acetylglutaminylglutamine synthetase [Marivibrio halodurans]